MNYENLKLKPLSGRVMFRKDRQANGLSLPEIDARWKNLPIESKKYWERKGRGGAPRIKKSTLETSRLKRILKSGSDVKI